MKKIDIHMHTRAFPSLMRIGTNHTYLMPDEIRQRYEEWGIEKGVILPGICNEMMYHIQSNEEAYTIYKENSDILYWFCNLHPKMGKNSPDTDFTYFLEHYKKWGAKGVGELTANMYIDDPMTDNLFYHCAKNDMPVTIHMAPQIGGYYGLVDDLGLPGLEKMLDKHKNLKILGHSQIFWSEISRDVNQDNRGGYPEGEVKPGRLVELFKNYKGLYGDLSAGSGQNAIIRDEDFGLWFLEEFQDQLFFGTDASGPTVYFELGSWLDKKFEEGKLSESAYKKICRNNALKILEK